MTRSLSALLLGAALVAAAEHRGIVTFNGLPVPGVTVTLTQGAETRQATTGAAGDYTIAVADGAFQVEVRMQLFAPQQRSFTDAAAKAEWVLELLPRAQIQATRQTPAFQQSAVTAAAPVAKKKDDRPGPAVDPEVARQAADGFLINGSVNNANTSPFAQLPAFGNNRRNQRSLYNGSLGLILNNAAFDARAYSLTGQNTIKPDYSRVQGLLAFGGPFRIPRLLERRGPNFTVNYQWTRNRNATTETALVPTLDQRNGLLGNGVVIPASEISPQARELLKLYPLPNFTGSTRYNFQIPLVRGLHQDDLQARAQKQVRRNNYSGNFSSQSTRTDSPNLFGFLDTGRINGWNSGFGYRRNLGSRSFVNSGANFNRLSTRTNPWFANRTNVSALAGITGNNQEAINWGPPNLFFTGGITPLFLDQASLVRNQTSSVNGDYFIARNGHNVSMGAIQRWQQFNILAQQDARGTFGFTGNDFAHFLLGQPDTSNIAFGNADKYLRGRVTEAFLSDDWRLSPGLTINAGMRWEYWTPVTEKYGRLVNLDRATGIANRTLPQPDRNNFAPRVALSWRPFAASSMIVRTGYGIYYDTSIYQPIASQMSQQAPLSRSLRLSNTPATPLTLASGFPLSTGAASATTYGVDPNFRIGYAHTWRASVQSDLPAALQVNLSYTGSKGARGQQQILPNTFPGGVTVAPFGFTWLVSDGDSIRHAGELQVRRRLRSGLTAEVRYTWAKSLDNALLGGRGRALIAQNWLDLGAERGRSSFDQRHLVAASFQYTTGKGLRQRWMKDWTLASQLTAGTGLPLTPLISTALAGYNGILRPDAIAPGVYALPAPGRWGNAGRNTINGPHQFGINSSLGRTLRSWDRVNLDMRIDVTNSTNTPTFPSINTTLGNAQFGLPSIANPMRAAQVTIRAGF